MSYLSKRVAMRALVLALASALALAVVGAANAEFPTKRSDPSIHGTPQEGQTLNGRTGQWLMHNGLPCTDCKMRYTWQRCNVGPQRLRRHSAGAPASPICSAPTTSASGSASSSGSSSGTAGSQQRHGHRVPRHREERGVRADGVDRAEADRRPAVHRYAHGAGTPMEDEVLRATGATWTGQGTITKAFFWQRCNTAGEGCFTVPGATGATYRLTPSDVDARIRVVETAANEGGAAQAVSPVTAVVDELMPTVAARRSPSPRSCCPTASCSTRWSRSRRATTVTLRVKVSDDRGFRVGGVQVKVTPTGLLAGPPAPKTSPAERLGHVHLPRDRHRHDLRVRRGPPEGREAAERGSRPPTCSRSASARPL